MPNRRNQVLAGDIAAYFPTFGLMIVRSGATENDTYASIKAGARHTQHQHYDENSFIIYRRGFQALDTGERGSGGASQGLLSADRRA